MWWRDRHIFHGRLLAAGHAEGANDVDLFDAACLVVAELVRLSEQTGMTYNYEGAKKLRETLTLGQRRPDNALAEAERMRAEMEGAAGISRPAPAEGEPAMSRTERLDRAMQEMMDLRAEIEDPDRGVSPEA